MLARTGKLFQQHAAASRRTLQVPASTPRPGNPVDGAVMYVNPDYAKFVALSANSVPKTTKAGQELSSKMSSVAGPPPPPPPPPPLLTAPLCHLILQPTYVTTSCKMSLLPG